MTTLRILTIYSLFLLSVFGLLDSAYLTYEHFQGTIPPCSINSIFSDCGTVLRSEYSKIFGIPLALIGLAHYILITITLYRAVFKKSQNAALLGVFLSLVGLISSIYFVYLQLVVIGAICIYCMGSAISSFGIFIIIQFLFSRERKLVYIYSIKLLYKYILKLFLFKTDPEMIHTNMVKFGELLGTLAFIKIINNYIFRYKDTSLAQTVCGIKFDSPIGLAAGFDYEARLTQILPSLGFGFQTVGTITKSSYIGNPRPMLGRLPKSRSLMVNKGFKNLGAKATIAKLRGKNFNTPLGISIGRTNSKSLSTQRKSIVDIIETFKLFEKSRLKHSYYELNISCPNLFGHITFYPPENLEPLLHALDKLKLKKPVFVKMPIDKDNKQILSMLAIIVKHNIDGVIFGNLQRDRTNPIFDQKELAQFPNGNFSGKPTYDRSNELISLTYSKYKNKLVIIGCGGVFSPMDAYEKIKRGATLVQFITGMIFEGPQLASHINVMLPDLLKKDGFTNISQARGKHI